MDINAITGALTKALARFSEIKNTDLYKSLPESDREEKIAHELSRDIGTLLAAQPEFQPDRIIDPGVASAVIGPALVQQGRRRGAGAAVEWLQKILSTRKARGFNVQALYGIRIASVTPLVDDINLIPFDALPDSRQKKGLLEHPLLSPYHPPPFYAFTKPSAALIVPAERTLFFVKPNTAQTQEPRVRVGWETRFNDMRHCLAFSHGEPIISGPSWFQYEDSDYEEVGPVRFSASMPHQEILPMPIVEEGEMDLCKAAKTVRAYFALDEGIRRKVRTAIERVHLAFIRSSPEDKALELSIALETLLIDSPGEHTFKISLRAALLTAENINTGATNRAMIRALYTLRSNLVHGGQSKSEVKVDGKKVSSRDVAKRATKITISVIQSMLTAGKSPDWSDVELSPKGKSAG